MTALCVGRHAMAGLVMFLVASAALLVGGCRDLNLRDGFPCSAAGGCPSPFQCDRADNRCYRSLSSDGGRLDAGGEGGRADAGADTGMSGGPDGGQDTGVIVVPAGTVERGQPCAQDADCRSGSCREDVCCESTCNGGCSACAEAYTGLANGTCGPVKAGVDPRNTCAVGAPESCGDDGMCNGAGACRKYGANQICGAAACAGSQFSAARTCDGAGACAPAVTSSCGTFPCTPSGCASPCAADGECPAASYCADGTCRVRKTGGESCALARECVTNRCVDGVCCADDCTGACMACSQMHTGQRSGTCQPVLTGRDPDDDCSTEAPSMCGRDGTCDGSGACRRYDSTTTCAEASCAGTIFTPARTCNNGVCGGPPTVDCQQSQCTAQGCRQGCVADTDCAASSYCAMQSCMARKANGQACTGGNQCVSRACVDGVCCETGCTGTCFACSMAKTGQASGKCAPVTAGSDADGECAETGAATCGTDGQCDGAGACRRWSSGTECAAGACNAQGNYQPARSCDGSGTCAPAAPDVCAPNICTPTGCNRMCAVNQDCVGNTYCASGRCAAKKSTGMSCMTAAECLMGNCVDGVCCGMPCAGRCNACTMAKTGQPSGTCAPVPAGQDPDNECAADGANACGLDGSCDGGNACRVRPLSTPCGTASCSAGVLTPAGSCDGVNSCTPSSARPCPGGFTCLSATACRTSCTAGTSATDCAAGNYCSGSTCVPKRAAGLSCGSAIECASNACVDAVCCGSACTLTACTGCSTAVTGMPNGTCAQRTAAATRPCPATNPTACVNLQSDPQNCSGCGNVCPSPGAGTTPACLLGQCGAGCATAGSHVCTTPGGVKTCKSASAGFETADPSWYHTGDATLVRTSARFRTGAWSFGGPASFAPEYPAVAYKYLCDDNGTTNATMDVRGKTISAWIWLSASAASRPDSRCRLLADNDPAISLGASATRSLPLPVATWFQLTGTFPSSASAIKGIYIACDLPNTLTLSIDDVSIN